MLGYALPVKTRYEMTEKVKENGVLDIARIIGIKFVSWEDTRKPIVHQVS